MSGDTSMMLVHNPDRDRYELWDRETFMGLVGYERDGDVYILLHTVVEEEYGQQGIARLLVSLVLTRMRLDGHKIRPVCSYVRRFLTRFPEYQLLVAAA
ncbi:GNAT family N-acetyltransferase [Dietzia sp. 179-F 9C3 NHS]|uniref:GNAT family N-acetyltransferase n=1 Tax=Dietzia sp. 179-F 9C3 NHS TaxID=3374295 RepID=UPI00387A4570